jgi:hypothetical protein
MSEYYTSTGRYDLSTGDILHVETNLPLKTFDLPDFFQTGNRISSNLLYNQELRVGSYYVDTFNKFYPDVPPSGSLEYEKRKIGIDSIWSTDFVKSKRFHDYYTWTGVEFSGDVEGVGIVEVAGLTYSGYSEGTLTGNYIFETGEAPSITFAGKSVVLVSKGATYSNFATTFFSGLRGLVSIRPLLEPQRDISFVDSETETGRAYLSNVLLNNIPNWGNNTNISWDAFNTMLDKLDGRDNKIFLLRDSDTSNLNFISNGGITEQETIDRIKSSQIPIYDFYTTPSNTQVSNPLESVTTFSYSRTEAEDAYISTFKQIPVWVSDQITVLQNGPSSNWLSPADTFQFDTSEYSFVGGGYISGSKTGSITGGLFINVFDKPVILKTQVYGNYYEDKFRGNIDVSISGRVRFKDMFEEFFSGDGYGIRISGENYSNSLVTGDMFYPPYSGEPYVEGKYIEKSVNFKNFNLISPINLDGFFVNGISVNVSGSPSYSGEIYLASGVIDVNKTINTGITGDFDFFDISFLNEVPEYFVNTSGSKNLISGDNFHTYLISDASGYTETAITNGIIIPTDISEDTFTKSIDPFFSRSISGDQVVDGIKDERVEDLLPRSTNLLKTTIQANGTGRAFISGTFQGDITYTGIYYKDDDSLDGILNPAHDWNYKISDLSDFNLTGLEGDNKVRIVDDSGEDVQISSDVDIILLFDRSGSMGNDIRGCSAAIAASELFDYRIINGSIYSYLSTASLEFESLNMVTTPGAYEEMQSVLNNIGDLFRISGGTEAMSQAIIDLDNDGRFDTDSIPILCIFTDEYDDSPGLRSTAINILTTKNVRTFIFCTDLNFHNNYLGSLTSFNGSQAVNINTVNAANFGILVQEVATKGFSNLDIISILSIDNADLNDYIDDLYFEDASYSQEDFWPLGSLFIKELELSGETRRGLGIESNVDDDFAILVNDEVVLSPSRNITWYSHSPPYSVWVVGGKITANSIDYPITDLSSDYNQIFKVSDTWDGYGSVEVSNQDRIDEIELLHGPVEYSSLELVVTDNRRLIRGWNAKPLVSNLDENLSVGVYSKPFIPNGFNISTESSNDFQNAFNRSSEELIGTEYTSIILNSIDWPYVSLTSGQSSPEYVWSYTGNIYPDDKLEIAVFDGWAEGCRIIPWSAKLTWSDGLVTRETGGYYQILGTDSAKIRSRDDTGLTASQYTSETGGGPWGESYIFYESGKGIIDITRDEKPKFVQDIAYIQYDTSGIPYNIAQGVGFSVRYQESISFSDPNFSELNKPEVKWEDVGFICNLELLGKINEDGNDDDGEDEDGGLCDPPPGCPGTEGGGGAGGEPPGGGGGNGGNEDKSVSGAFFSGSIDFNKLSLGDYLEFSPYNFDFSGKYMETYGTGFPSNYNLDNKFYYDRRGNNISTFSNATELSYLLNSYYNTFTLGTKRGIWQSFKVDIEEYANDKSGDFYNGPLLKATPINSNFLQIQSLIYGEMGGYKIEFNNQDGIDSKYQYSMPISIGVQASDNGQRWKNLMLKDFNYDGNSHELITDGLELQKQPLSFIEGSELRVDNEKEGIDSIIINSNDHSIISGDGVFLNQVESIGLTFTNLGYGVFTGVGFPEEIDVSDFYKEDIQFQYSGNYSGSLLGFVSGYKVVKPQEEDDNELDFADIIYPCPSPKIVKISKSVIIESGLDSFGNYYTISQDEEAECSGCDNHSQIPMPVGHPINSGVDIEDPNYIKTGYVLCKEETPEQEEEKLIPKLTTISYSGFFTGFQGENIFPSNNTYFTGSFKADLEPKALFEITNQVAVYPVNTASLFFEDISVIPNSVIKGEEEESNPESDPTISFRTGFIFENEKPYRYYRLFYSGFSVPPLEEGFLSQSGITIFDEINLYGPTNYQFDLSGSQEITLYDATYSGNLQVPVFGSVTGIHTGSSFSGVLPVNENKTGIITSDFFYNGEQVYATDFFGNYVTNLTGIGEASGTITGLFYNTETSRLYNKIEVQKTVTGYENVKVEVNQIDDIFSILGSTNEQILIDIEASARFTGLGNVKAFQSGINSFTTVSGSETGFINDGSGSYDFYRSQSFVFGEKLLLQNGYKLLTEDSGNLNLEALEIARIFNSTPSGYINSQITLNYNNPIINDRIIIDNNAFVRNTGNQLPNLFKDITGLSNVINSGEFGFIASISDSSTLQIYTNALGDLGNSITASSIGSSGKPTFQSDTFTGGQNLHQPLSGYGTFSGSSSETINNTGIYEVDYTGEISGIINIYTGNKYFTDTWGLHSGRYNKDYSFKSGIPSGVITSIYEDGYNYLGIYPSQFNLFIDYVPSDLIDYDDTNNEADVAELIVTGINLTGYKIPIYGDK